MAEELPPAPTTARAATHQAAILPWRTASPRDRARSISGGLCVREHPARASWPEHRWLHPLASHTPTALTNRLQASGLRRTQAGHHNNTTYLKEGNLAGQAGWRRRRPGSQTRGQDRGAGRRLHHCTARGGLGRDMRVAFQTPGGARLSSTAPPPCHMPTCHYLHRYYFSALPARATRSLPLAWTRACATPQWKTGDEHESGVKDAQRALCDLQHRTRANARYHNNFCAQKMKRAAGARAIRTRGHFNGRPYTLPGRCASMNIRPSLLAPRAAPSGILASTRMGVARHVSPASWRFAAY